MKKEILHTMALDNDNRLIHIGNADKGEHYFCPICKKEFILRKSGKTGKGSRRPHFAHNELSPNCNPESVLHYFFKRLLIEKLRKFIEENRPFQFSWKCIQCNEIFLGNLLEKVSSIKEEYSLGDCRPDIALLDTKEKTIAVIEIVVTHEPEEKVLQYYKGNDIVYIRIDLSSEDDLLDVEEIAVNPYLVGICNNPTCDAYDDQKTSRKIRVIKDRCGRCLYPIEKYYIEIESIFGQTINYSFLDDEIELVKSKRNNIEVKVNKDAKQKYPIFICMNCKRIQSKYRRSRL